MSSFELIIWNVEHGSAALVRTPNERTIALDAGNSGNFSPAVYLASQYRIKAIDHLIISHPDKDHISDLPNIYQYIKPKMLSRNKTIPKDAIYPSGTTNLQEPLLTYKRMDEEYNTPLSGLNTLEPISNWGEVFVKTFYCSPSHFQDGRFENKNNLSLLTYIRYGDLEIVFPGDLEPLGWEQLINHTQVSDFVGRASVRILVAPHHGRESGIKFKVDGKNYVYNKFLDLMKPGLVIISDKWGNETTDPESYRPYSSGLMVNSKSEIYPSSKKIISTKTNDYVYISSLGQNPTIHIP